jgi:hypothetical protein
MILEKHMWEYCPRCSHQRGAHSEVAVAKFSASLPSECPSPAECRHELALIIDASSAAERGVHGGQLL